MSNIASLANIATISAYGAATCLPPQSFSFNGTNGYIQQTGYSGGVVRKLNDGSRDYWQCYGGYFNIGDSAVHGLDNRSVQTMKFVFQIDDNLNVVNLSSYTTNGSISVETDGRIQVEVQGTGSLRIFSVTTVTPGQIYNVVVKYNNTLPSGTQRVVGDATMFINGVKESSPTTQATGNSTGTASILYRGSYNAASSNFRGRLYNFSLWNRALSDAECQAEGLSNRSVVTPSGLVNTWDATDTSQAISRTGYNLTGGGNYSVATDGDGKYVLINGNKDQTAGTGTASGFSGGSFSFTQKSTFSFAFKVKINNLPPNNYSGIFGSGNNFSAGLHQSGGNFIRIISKPTYSSVLVPITLGVACTIHVCYEPTTGKAYVYKDGVIQNSGGTAMSPTFTAGSWILGDMGGETNTLVSSSSKNIYFARVRQRTLTQSDVTADIALGNNTNNDPTIVASYRPDNLINQQFLSNTSDYTNAAWTKVGTTVTGDFSTAPDGSTTADSLAIAGALHNGISQTSTILTGSSLASKTLITKAFMRVASGTGTVRIRLDHAGVDSNQYSGDLTVTTTWQEFTFSRTLTSSTGGTGIITGISTGTAGAAVTVEVWNIRTFLVNEILYDNSPNMGGYVGPLSNRYYSSWVRLGADGTASTNSQPVGFGAYSYLHIRDTANNVNARYDNRIGAMTSSTSILSGNRGRSHIVSGMERNGTSFKTVLYLNGTNVADNIQFLDASHSLQQALIWLGRISTTYYTGNLRDFRFFTSPTALSGSDVQLIRDGGDPAGVTKVLHRGTNPSNAGNLVPDLSGNGRVGRMTGGVTRGY